MSTLTNGTNLTGSMTLTKQSSNVITLSTKEKYVEKDIQLTIDVTSGALSSTGGSVSGTNVTLSDTNTSGISVVGSGKGTVTTAGWIAAGAASSSSSQTKYLTGVKLTPGNSFSIQVPNGNTTDYITFNFTVDSSGNVTID